jgi:GNAT superfamily N-acetyltransferase
MVRAEAHDPEDREMSAGADDYTISTAADRVDIDFVCAALAQSYWAQNRARGVIEQSIKNSICFGAYERASGRQVGFARVVTDGATFSWLCDVVVDGAHRKKGLGKLLVSAVVGHPGLKGTMFLLGTRDAHGLYERYGFVRTEMMRRAATVAEASPPKEPS